MTILANKQFLGKSRSVAIEPLLVPNFMPSFGKIFRAFFEKIRYANYHEYHKGLLTCFCFLHGLSCAFFSTWRLNFSRTEICTAKPMIVSCVEHYTTHFSKKIGKSLEPFFHKVPKKCEKMAKMPILAKSAIV